MSSDIITVWVGKCISDNTALKNILSSYVLGERDLCVSDLGSVEKEILNDIYATVVESAVFNQLNCHPQLKGKFIFNLNDTIQRLNMVAAKHNLSSTNLAIAVQEIMDSKCVLDELPARVHSLINDVTKTKLRVVDVVYRSNRNRVMIKLEA